MHYYSFNIGDYAKHARHLSNSEDLAYRRLLDLYYLEEKPLTSDTKKLSKLIGMRENQEDLEYVLETFFVMEDDGFHNKRADRDISEYHAKADTARANGRKGGRPKKADSNPEKTGLEPKKTQSVNLANPEETGSKANHKPITNNHKPNKAKPSGHAEVQAYFEEKGYAENGIGQKFVDHYDSIGWKRGKQPVKDWKATARTWMTKMKKTAPMQQPSSAGSLEEIMKL